jgi:farnesyl diphosphate synthase
VLAQTGAGAEARLKVVAELAGIGLGGHGGGQAIDLQNVGKAMTREALEGMHRMKTGALLRASVRMGALCGNIDRPALWRLIDMPRPWAWRSRSWTTFSTSRRHGNARQDGGQGCRERQADLRIAAWPGCRTRAGCPARTDAHEALEGFGTRAGRLAELADLIVLRSN